MTTMTDSWVPEARPVPEALQEGFEAPPYVDPWNSVGERLDKAMRERLEAFKLLGGGIGDVSE